jgi:hypothetical protein
MKMDRIPLPTKSWGGQRSCQDRPDCSRCPLIFIGLGLRDKALTLLEQAYDERSDMLVT